MLRTILGALVGREVSQNSRGSGVKGAVIGGLLTRGLSRMGPLGMAASAAYLGKKAYDRRKAARAGIPPRV
ncbi:hypothetical protein [uncultured Sphingomonas sp.]|uniref:hypothetical protein n=1 Tax=uncultured Sphingomonas sp. TaxID=158754 RepID=UPI0025DDD74A|nr:hypothetical protein [uncultured Sphingomonas sp.]